MREACARAEGAVAELAGAGATVAAAESCTGGMVGAAFTSVPGASAVYLGGVTSYASAVKEKLLGVPKEILETEGAVSAACAEKMAEGVRAATGADIGVSVTGVAGPGPDGGVPAGTVWFGVASRLGTRSVRGDFAGGRAEVRSAAAAKAVELAAEEARRWAT